MNKKEKLEVKNSVQNLLLSITDPINNLSNNEETNIILVDALIPYANHPFKLYEGNRFSDMIRSIKEMGILLPIIVRPINDSDKYEILSGHNRVNAAKAAGLNEIPAIIKRDLDDDEAKLIVTETNLVQRSFADLSHSERAIALKHHIDAIKAQGKRTDIIDEVNLLLNADKTDKNGTSYQLDTKLRSNEKTGNKYGLSSASVARYIRINYLNNSLQNRVNNEEISLIPAVSLSYLSSNEQAELDRILNESKYKVNMKKAELLRDLSKNQKLTAEKIEQILSGKINTKPKSKYPAPFKIKHKIYSKYFDETINHNEAESIIDKALEEYFNRHSEQPTILK